MKHLKSISVALILKTDNITRSAKAGRKPKEPTMRYNITYSVDDGPEKTVVFVTAKRNLEQVIDAFRNTCYFEHEQTVTRVIRIGKLPTILLGY